MNGRRAKAIRRQQRQSSELLPRGAYWHGGPAGLTGKIVPASVSGKVAGGREDRVYITPRLTFATLYASHFREPMLYAVVPDSEPEPDPEISQLRAMRADFDDRDSLMTSSAMILFTRTPRREAIDTARAKLIAPFVEAGLTPGAAMALLWWDPPTCEPCELCAAEQCTPRLHEDDVCWVALCETCDVPMVVLKRHTIDASDEELDHMGRHLGRVAADFFRASWHFDTAMRSIPDHFHAHARPTLMRESPPLLPLRVCSLAEAIEVVESDPPRAVVSLVDSVDAVPFRLERHLLRECLDINLPDLPAAAGRAEVEAIVDFAREIGPEPGVLVHCNMGVSRSTAAAFVMLVTWGWLPCDALDALSRAHATDRPFMPNQMMMEAAMELLAAGDSMPRAS